MMDMQILTDREALMIWMTAGVHMTKMVQDIMALKNEILSLMRSGVEGESLTHPAVMVREADLQARSALLNLDICLLTMMTERTILPSIWTSEF